MYEYNVSENHLSYPSISCPIISEQLFNQNSAVQNIHFNSRSPKFMSSRHSEISIFRSNDQIGREKVVKNIFTKLRSPSSEELAALLTMSSDSCKLLPDETNFYHYWNQVLRQQELQNRNVTNSASEKRNMACLCKPLDDNTRSEAGDNLDYETVKNKGCLCIPKYSFDNSGKKFKIRPEKGKKRNEEIDGENTTSNVRGSSKEIKVCLPLDPGELGEGAQGKGIKLVIYGDKKYCDCKSCKTGVASRESSSYECLACTISKNPQFKSILTDLANGHKKKNKKSGFSSRFPTKLSSTFPFFKKKHKDIQSTQCSDKCQQTCSQKSETTMMDKACSCTSCCSKPVVEKNNGTGLCSCTKCGKVDIQKVITDRRTCNCGGDDTLKLVLKMEAKQNYRQIKHILKEMKDQRQEIRDLHKRYTSLMKMQIGRGGGDSYERFRDYFSNPHKLEYGLGPPDQHKGKDIKQLKDAINQSTIDKENLPEKHDAVTDIKASELSLFDEHYKNLENKGLKEVDSKSINSVSFKTEMTDNEDDSCICLMHKIRKSSNKWGNFWRGLRRKPKVCPKKCDCKATKSAEKCRNILEKKIKGFLYQHEK